MRCAKCKKLLGLTNGDKARNGDYCICKKCGVVLRFLDVKEKPIVFEIVSQRELTELQRKHPLVHRKIIEALLAAGRAPHHMRVLVDKDSESKASAVIRND